MGRLDTADLPFALPEPVNMPDSRHPYFYPLNINDCLITWRQFVVTLRDRNMLWKCSTLKLTSNKLINGGAGFAQPDGGFNRFVRFLQPADGRICNDFRHAADREVAGEDHLPAT